MDYDSTGDTMLHIHRVGDHMTDMVMRLMVRMRDHDASKLADPEKAMFDEFTPKLAEMEYGSPEYKACTTAMRESGGLQHHYANNSHHPEYYENGVNGMSLLDVMEMLCDWKAAGERHADGGDIMRSIMMNRDRYGLSQQMVDVMMNTAMEMGWVVAGSMPVEAGNMVMIHMEAMASGTISVSGAAESGEGMNVSVPDMSGYSKVLWVGERGGSMMMDLEDGVERKFTVTYIPRAISLRKA